MWETKDATTNWFKTPKHIDMDNRAIIGVLDPTSPQGAANKQYVDDSIVKEGVDILSTGEVRGQKFLREDGDDTCSWQVAPSLWQLSGNVRLITAGEITLQGHKLVEVPDPINNQDAATKKYVDDNTHTQNTDTALGSGAVAADHTAAATDEIINVCYGTGDPPAAETTTEGTLYMRYTA